jgi:hypothetical protein
MRIALVPTLVGLAVVTGIVGCARHPGGDAAAILPSRRFYLTKATFQGNKVLDACERGFHTASRYEIFNVSLLQYDSARGFVTDDSGTGPPGRSTAYGGEDAAGWVRTGGTSRFTDIEDALGSAVTNCAAWSTNSAQAFGTIAYLTDRFTSDGGSPLPLWNGGPEPCSTAHHVWCLDDGSAAAAHDEAPEGRRRWRHGRAPE